MSNHWPGSPPNWPLFTPWWPCTRHHCLNFSEERYNILVVTTCGTFSGPLARVPTRLATGHTFDHSRLKNMASEKDGGNIRWIMSEENNLEMFGLFCVPPILMAPPPYPLHPDVSQPGSFCLRAVSHQNICKSMCGNWKSPVYNSWSPFSFLTNVITRCRKYFEKDEPIGIQAWKSKKIHSDTILEIPLFSHRCHHNGHRITYCCQNESTENH